MVNGKRYRDYTYVFLIVFFALYIINTPGGPDIGDFQCFPFNPPEGLNFRNFCTLQSAQQFMKKISDKIKEWVIIKTIPIWFRIKKGPRIWFIDQLFFSATLHRPTPTRLRRTGGTRTRPFYTTRFIQSLVFISNERVN